MTEKAKTTTTKRTATRKASPATKKEAQQKTQEVTETEATKQKPVVKKRTEIDPSRLVLCKNVTNSGLTYISRKTNMPILWMESGDEEYVSVQELMTMRASQPRFLNEPWIIINDETDEDVIEYLGLKKLYENIIDTEEIDNFLVYSSPEEIEAKLKKAPNGTRKLIRERAHELIQERKLYNMLVVELLEKELNVDLRLLQ